MYDQPYHKYVFDMERREFLGQFEEMYKNEDMEKYDSWFQEDDGHHSRRLSLLILEGREYGRILDLGCGKGAFTRRLKKSGNYVLGVDISLTAIEKAREK